MLIDDDEVVEGDLFECYYLVVMFFLVWFEVVGFDQVFSQWFQLVWFDFCDYLGEQFGGFYQFCGYDLLWVFVSDVVGWMDLEMLLVSVEVVVFFGFLFDLVEQVGQDCFVDCCVIDFWYFVFVVG